MSDTTTTTAPKVCFCGCGGTTKSKFVPGHDARFHGLAKRVIRGQAPAEAAMASLPHDEAREAFLAYSDKITEAEATRAARKLAEAEAKAAEKAAVAKAKADAKAALAA